MCFIATPAYNICIVYLSAKSHSGCVLADSNVFKVQPILRAPRCDVAKMKLASNNGEAFAGLNIQSCLTLRNLKDIP